MIIAFSILMLIIVCFFIYLSFSIFRLLVEIVKLKKIRQVVKSKKRFSRIKIKVKKIGLNQGKRIFSS